MSLILIHDQQAATRRASGLVLRWFDLGHALLVEQMLAVGVAVPERFLPGDSPRDVGPAGEADLVDDEAES